jgi:hypothetical protein
MNKFHLEVGGDIETTVDTLRKAIALAHGRAGGLCRRSGMTEIVNIIKDTDHIKGRLLGAVHASIETEWTCYD